MKNIEKKEFEWGKVIRFRVIASIFVCILLCILIMTGESYLFGSGEATIWDKVLGVLFGVMAIWAFVQYLYMRKNNFYVLTTDEEIEKSSLSVDLDFSSGTTKWKDISRFENNPGGITLIVKNDDDVKIKLNYLNKDDREKFIQIVKEHVEHKPTI
jgi:hypothetical protein